MDLSTYEGKKLVWAGFDEDSGKHYLFFEDLSALAVEMITEISDGRVVAKAILANQLEAAQKIISLKGLVDSSSNLRMTIETHPDKMILPAQGECQDGCGIHQEEASRNSGS